MKSRGPILKNRIRVLRAEKGLSQTQLAEMVGSTQNTISRTESGNFIPSAYLAGLICLALECKWEECFYFEMPESGKGQKDDQSAEQ